MEILKATAQNIKVNKLSFIDCPLLKIETMEEMQPVQECLQRNLSLTALNLNETVDNLVYMTLI